MKPAAATRSLQRIQRAGRDMEAVIDAFLILAREADVDRRSSCSTSTTSSAMKWTTPTNCWARPVSVHLHSDGPVQLHAPPRVLRWWSATWCATPAATPTRAHRRACSTTVVVRDTGIGMSAEALSRAFEPFYRAESQPPAGNRPGPVDRAPAVRSLRLEGQPGQRAGAGHRGDGDFPLRAPIASMRRRPWSALSFTPVPHASKVGIYRTRARGALQHLPQLQLTFGATALVQIA
jgi:hypothetical protein